MSAMKIIMMNGLQTFLVALESMCHRSFKRASFHTLLSKRPTIASCTQLPPPRSHESLVAKDAIFEYMGLQRYQLLDALCQRTRVVRCEFSHVEDGLLE